MWGKAFKSWKSYYLELTSAVKQCVGKRGEVAGQGVPAVEDVIFGADKRGEVAGKAFKQRKA